MKHSPDEAEMMPRRCPSPRSAAGHLPLTVLAVLQPYPVGAGAGRWLRRKRGTCPGGRPGADPGVHSGQSTRPELMGATWAQVLGTASCRRVLTSLVGRLQAGAAPKGRGGCPGACGRAGTEGHMCSVDRRHHSGFGKAQGKARKDTGGRRGDPRLRPRDTLP